ncbi:MAG: hypothetical protein IJ594_06695, partial [Oscillospiraceae bacterium]|nr:hypothetical protein [Oscillospiraceae bacterium]
PTPEPEPTPCPHPAWEDGVCAVCGEPCAHPAWENGACTVCGLACEHPAHDAQTRVCAVCGETVYHRYVGGVCACGAQPLSYDYVLPDRFYEPCEHPGTIESWDFQNAVPGWATYTRHLLIYLPYGYDPEGQYDLLLLMHGTGDDETAWLTCPHYVPDRMMEVRTIFDHMIDEQLIRPLIIVTVGLYEDFGGYVGDPTEERLAVELREIILPHLVETYATYAAGGDPAQLEAAREHFAIGGLSWGSYFSYASGMRLNLPYFGSFICFSGNDNPDLVLSVINAPELIGYPIYLYYSAAGTTDMAHYGGINNFNQIVKYTDRLVEGENAFLHETEGGHTWNVWSTEIFNALQLCFQS